ncbi:2'-5'-oligoadenylate synthase 3 [Lepus europaeus]|uniref:2'-5'-oligoadenylate synthase 3 n=1 Tax=Lepus europaeus TaxID=9983 RepID=UPI002B48B7DD|nr:2'-5'-oligoadenylate synthase 3 [Lepus europaeus]
MDVYRTPAAALDRLVARSLQPDGEFAGSARRALGALLAALRERGGRGGAAGQPALRVRKSVQGGSCGRGTALRGGSDCELVVFLECFKSFEDQRAGRAEVLRELQALLDAWGRQPGPGLKLESPVQATGGLLRFRLAAVDLENWMDVTLVPAFDALGQIGAGAKPEPQVYSTLLVGGCQGGEHAVCFTELRRSFVNTRPAKLKNLILLVKHWYRQVCPKEAGEGTLPPAYALELLTIFAWEQGCGKDAFSLARGLRTVLGLIQCYQQLCVFWTVNYSFEDPAVSQFLQGQLKRPRPVILDPADPTWDVGNGTTWHWEVLALEAESCYHHPCFLQGTGDPVQPWEGPGLPQAGGSDLGHPIQRNPGQGTPEDGERLNTVHPGPPRPALGPSEAAPSPSPSPSPAGLAMDLAQIPSKELDRFIQEHLKPSPRFQEQVKKAIDAILCCLREKCAHKASRVSKGGSFGRGTDLRGGCDVELVIFLHCFTDYTAQGPSRAEVLAEMRAQLESWCREPGPGLSLRVPAQDGAKALRCRLESSALEGCVDISLLPAFDAVGQLGAGAKPRPQVYSALLGSGCQGGEHAACFAELRRSFVNTRPAKLKNLILLIKHWYRRVAAQDKGKQPASASLPPAYALELLTIFAWEQGCGKDRFPMAEGLRTVLELVRQHQQLCVYWTLNYGIEDPAVRTHLLGQLRKPRPLILDPADPTWNVGQGNWELLAREAAALGTQACFTSRDGTAVQPWDVLPALLHQTPAADLDKFISEFLQPNRQFLAQVNKAVNAICSFLRENCFRNSPIKVLKVVKGGSSAKGTALRGRSDADLVVFLSCFGQFSEQGNRRAEVIAEIRAQLEACQQERQFEVKFEISKWENPRVLSFSLSSPTMLDQSVDFDVLPAFDALGQLVAGSRPSSQVYVDLIHSYSHAGEFSTCFTELQRDFIVSRPTKLKSLIRLVKYWYLQCNKMPKGRGSLPPQHGLELLTVYAWEQAGRDAQFSMAEGFRTVLELVSQYRQLRVYWTLNYDTEDKTIRDFLELQLQKPRPIILDPADPTGNLGHSARWDLLAKEAATYMSSLCCMDRDGAPIQPWPVKQFWAGSRERDSSGFPHPIRYQHSSQPAAMGNWESQVSSVPAQQLGDFVQNSLRPYEECQRQISHLVDVICSTLQEPEEFPIVRGVARGGSYGRKTVLRGRSDGTLVLFLDHFQQFRDQKESRRDVLKILGHRLMMRMVAQGYTDNWEVLTTQDGLVIKVSTRWQSVVFEVLPAFNALGFGESPSPWVYRDLRRALDETQASPGTFAACFMELQEKFFNKYPRKLKDLILLIKYWRQQCQKNCVGSSVPPVYALELLTVYAWEQGCGAQDFDMAQGVRTVLQLVRQPENLCIYWTVNYNFEEETIRNTLLQLLRSTRPVILDPADPTNNVSGGPSCWQLLKEKAHAWLAAPSLNSELGSWNVLPKPLFMTPGHHLDKFIKEFLQPNEHFLSQVKQAIDLICKFLRENCFRNSTTKIQKIIKGGSMAKGTALKNSSDADLVVFPSSLQSYASQKTERAQVLREIREQLQAYQQKQQLEVIFEVSKWKNPRVLSFSLKSRKHHEYIHVDVLPAFNALGQLNSGSTPDPKVYTELIRLYKSPDDVLGGEFSTCFTELQRNFIVSRPTKLKDLIRLVKHWYQQCERKLKSRGSLPPKYALELLTVYAWEQGSGAEDFDTAEGFRTVLDLVAQYQQLCVFWTVNYSLDEDTMRTFLLAQIQKTRPVILDPAEPTGDVGGGNRWCWHLLAKEAKQWFSSPCFKNGAGYPVRPWKVPTMQTPASCGARMDPIVMRCSHSGIRVLG